MPGAGVNESTVADIVHYTAATEIHSSARTDVKSKMEHRNEHILMGDGQNDEYSFSVTDAGRVRSMIRLANG
jgi:copper homeostasis protein